MMPTTIRSTMRIEPIQRNDPSSSMLETTWKELIEPLFHVSQHAHFSEGSADNYDATMRSLQVELDYQSVDPTPINKRSQLNIVKEIKLGSWWHPDDDTELLRQLLIPPVDHEEATLQIPNSAPMPCTSSHGDDHHGSHVKEGVPSSQEDDETCQGVDRADKWHERFHELLKYRDEHGHCLVPHNWEGNRQLAQWVKRQRYQFKLKCEGKHSTVSDERMKILQKVGFVWSRHSAGWEERYNELVEFSRLHGHCNVPSTYPDNHQLSVWVRCQRRQYKLGQGNKPSTMTRERIFRLHRLGFVFNPRKVKF